MIYVRMGFIMKQRDVPIGEHYNLNGTNYAYYVRINEREYMFLSSGKVYSIPFANLDKDVYIVPKVSISLDSICWNIKYKE